MANTVYNKWMSLRDSASKGWNSATVIRALLVDGSSTYTVNRSHSTMQQLFSNGLVEVSASGYSRATVTNKQIYENTSSNPNRIEFRCDDVNFGNIAAGVTVKAVILFIQMAGTGNPSDDNPANDVPIMYIDQSQGPPNGVSFPFSTGGGSVVLKVPTDGLQHHYQA